MKESRKWGTRILLMITLLASACTSRSKLYGRWNSMTDLSAQGVGELVFEFTRDGVLRISVAGVAVDLNYEFVDSDTLRFVGTEGVDSVLTGQQVDWKVVGDTLTLVSSDQPMVFTRADPD